MYHNIIKIKQSCASEEMNNMLFNLLFLKHLRTSNDRCFQVGKNVVFTIEIPTELSGVHALKALRMKADMQASKQLISQSHEVFYLLFRSMEFPSIIVSI